MDIFVQRDAGDHRGDDVIDALMSEVSVLVARGRTLLDENASLQQPLVLTVKYRTGVRLGQLVAVHDALQGRSYRGKLTGISHKIDGGKVYTQLDILRPVEVF